MSLDRVTTLLHERQLVPADAVAAAERALSAEGGGPPNAFRLVARLVEDGKLGESAAQALLVEAAQSPARPGDRLEGKVIGNHRILEKLSEGGMGEVWLAEHVTIGRRVALKVILEERAGDEEAVARFEREAKVLAKINHAHVVRVFDCGREGTLRWFVMELVEGKSLAAVLEARGPIPAREAAAWARDTCLGLAAIHATGLVHRDVKPDNLLLSSEGRVKVADLGIAADASRTLGLTSSGTVIGTPLYMSPEHARGKKTDARSDLYSVGVTLYELLAGEPPFRAESGVGVLMRHIREKPPQAPLARRKVPPPLVEAVLALLAKDPRDRPQTAVEAAALLGGLVLAMDAATPERRDGERAERDRADRPRPRTVGAGAAARARGGIPWIALGIGGFAVAALAGVLREMGSGAGARGGDLADRRSGRSEAREAAGRGPGAADPRPTSAADQRASAGDPRPASAADPRPASVPPANGTAGGRSAAAEPRPDSTRPRTEETGLLAPAGAAGSAGPSSGGARAPAAPSGDPGASRGAPGVPPAPVAGADEGDAPEDDDPATPGGAPRADDGDGSPGVVVEPPPPPQAPATPAGLPSDRVLAAEERRRIDALVVKLGPGRPLDPPIARAGDLEEIAALRAKLSHADSLARLDWEVARRDAIASTGARLLAVLKRRMGQRASLVARSGQVRIDGVVRRADDVEVAIEGRDGLFRVPAAEIALGDAIATLDWFRDPARRGAAILAFEAGDLEGAVTHARAIPSELGPGADPETAVRGLLRDMARALAADLRLAVDGDRPIEAWRRLGEGGAGLTALDAASDGALARLRADIPRLVYERAATLVQSGRKSEARPLLESLSETRDVPILKKSQPLLWRAREPGEWHRVAHLASDGDSAAAPGWSFALEDKKEKSSVWHKVVIASDLLAGGDAISVEVELGTARQAGIILEWDAKTDASFILYLDEHGAEVAWHQRPSNKRESKRLASAGGPVELRFERNAGKLELFAAGRKLWSWTSKRTAIGPVGLYVEDGTATFRGLAIRKR